MRAASATNSLLPLLGAMRNLDPGAGGVGNEFVATPLRGDEELATHGDDRDRADLLLPLLGAMRNTLWDAQVGGNQITLLPLLGAMRNGGLVLVAERDQLVLLPLLGAMRNPSHNRHNRHPSELLPLLGAMRNLARERGPARVARVATPLRGDEEPWGSAFTPDGSQ